MEWKLFVIHIQSDSFYPVIVGWTVVSPLMTCHFPLAIYIVSLEIECTLNMINSKTVLCFYTDKIYGGLETWAADSEFQISHPIHDPHYLLPSQWTATGMKKCPRICM